MLEGRGLSSCLLASYLHAGSAGVHVPISCKYFSQFVYELLKSYIANKNSPRLRTSCVNVGS